MTTEHSTTASRATSVERPATAILLAAGESTRMGRPKPLLPWRGTTLIEYQVRELLAAGCDPLVVVLGHAAGDVRAAVPAEATVVVNERYREGRASSLRAGAAAIPDDATAVVVLSVDQPRPRVVIERLLSAQRASPDDIAVPTYDGRRGHPVVLPGALLPELRSATESQRGLRGVLEAHEAEIIEVAIDDPAVVLDINTPEDYERALTTTDSEGRRLPRPGASSNERSPSP
jgi:molybdenum cofactor cytidylyltransferase